MTCIHPDWARIATYDGYVRVERCDECQEITHHEPSPAPIVRRNWVHCDWCTRVIDGIGYMDEDETNLAIEFGDRPRHFCSEDHLRCAVRWAVNHR